MAAITAGIDVKTNYATVTLYIRKSYWVVLSKHEVVESRFRVRTLRQTCHRRCRLPRGYCDRTASQALTLLNVERFNNSYRLPGRPHIWANGVSWPSGKMDEKLKSENMQKRAVFWMGVGMKWYEWWLDGLADDYYYCYYYWSLPFFASIPLPLYFTKIPKFIKLLKRTVLRWPHIYSDILQNATFRSQIFKVLFVSGDKGALTP